MKKIKGLLTASCLLGAIFGSSSVMASGSAVGTSAVAVGNAVDLSPADSVAVIKRQYSTVLKISKYVSYTVGIGLTGYSIYGMAEDYKHEPNAREAFLNNGVQFGLGVALLAVPSIINAVATTTDPDGIIVKPSVPPQPIIPSNPGQPGGESP